MKLLRKKKCCHCVILFCPDSRNYKKQRYCSKPQCRKASKAESQRKWVQENPDYFRSPQNVFRVQQWLKKHPGYSKRGNQSSLQENSDALQDDIASSVDRMLKLGKDILNSSSFKQGGSYNAKTSHLSGKSAPGSKTIQLGRSPSGS